ncbi:MAG: hypothetical protein FRX49_00014 [Trebouxia sp. A1-2]|nr:MAG: hypothetical protein FRX49_00014 [Trebouxia sp. A1-2]
MSSCTGTVSSLLVQSRRARTRAPPTRFVQTRRVVTIQAEFAQHRDEHASNNNFQELQNNELDTSSASLIHVHQSNNKADILAQREEQLWQRQEALWQQQLAHWQHERTTWAQREAALLAHIQELHSHLAAISTRQIHNAPVAPPAPPSTQSAQGIHNEVQQQSDVAATASSSSTPPQLEYTPSLETFAPADIAQTPGTAHQPAIIGEADGTAAQMETPQGPPPPLCLGSDNIYWVHQLQSGLMDQGYYCGEEEMENFIFADDTQSAVLAFQACSGIEENGVADDATWQALLGDKVQPVAPPVDESALVETPDLPASKPSPDPVAPMTPKRNADAKDPHPWEASWGDLLSSQETDSEFDSDSSLSNSTASGSSSSDLPNEQAAALGDAKIRPADPSVGSPPVQWEAYVDEDKDYSKWTVLREGDGGRHVHELQTALVHQGFWPGEDDMLWWQFGSDTCSAVQTFQATANLPESGVVTSDTWQALLGPNAKPIDAKILVMNNETDEDMTADHEGAVYLVGEQRWARKPQM